MKNLVIFYGFDSALFYPLLVGENSNIMIDMCWQKMGPQFLTHPTFTHIYVKFAQMLCIQYGICSIVYLKGAKEKQKHCHPKARQRKWGCLSRWN